jgi:hypothetical protein
MCPPRERGRVEALLKTAWPHYTAKLPVANDEPVAARKKLPVATNDEPVATNKDLWSGSLSGLWRVLQGKDAGGSLTSRDSMRHCHPPFSLVFHQTRSDI